MGASASVVDTRESYASEEMKVVIALAVIALFGSAIATGSAPAGYEGEVDVLPEDDELVQAQAGDFFGEVARLKQPAKASWTKLERPVKVVKAGLPQDFAFSETASPSDLSEERYANVERNDADNHPRGGAGRMAKYDSDISANNGDTIRNPYVPGGEKPYSVRKAVEGARNDELKKDIKEMFKVPHRDE